MSTMLLIEILNIIALIIIPIITVILGRLLQDRSEKRNDKMAVFKAVLSWRYTMSRENVEALNSIPIIFSGKNTKDVDVRKNWKEYYKALCIQNPDGIQVKQKDMALYKLIESMAISLGYRDSITWEDIQNPYIPTGLIEEMNKNSYIQSGLAMILQDYNKSNNPKDSNC